MLQGRENLVLPLVIMGFISIIGAFTALRLPETLHHNLPQTVEEGEAFGKDWSFADCFSCPQKYLNFVCLSDSGQNNLLASSFLFFTSVVLCKY